ncbi:MAG: T9SS type A sorting domain-containing protein, partial [Bacteroidota bacterium]|nr:T9SS type A sorting domain-containing protein [Bacteroidota bacterium]
VHEGRSVATTSDSGFVVGTYKYTPGQPYTADPIIYKTDCLGNIEWTKNLGGPYMDYYPTVKMAPDGSIIVATCYADSMLSPDRAYRRINLINLDNNGNILWNRKYGESVIKNFLSNIEITIDNNFICTGYIYTIEKPELSGWIIKIDANGDSIWYRTYEHINGKDSENRLKDIKPTDDNGYISCGFIYPLPPDTGRQDIWLLKLDSIGCDTPGCDPTVGIKDYHIGAADQVNIQIFPNPSKDLIYCQLSTVNCQLSILIVDIYGRKIDEIKIPEGQKEVEITVSSYPQGIYIAVLQDARGIIGRKKFVVGR